MLNSLGGDDRQIGKISYRVYAFRLMHAKPVINANESERNVKNRVGNAIDFFVELC